MDALGDKPVRGRSVDALVTEAAVREELQRDLQSWVAAFEAPTFFRDAKNLVKLRAFLATKLAPRRALSAFTAPSPSPRFRNRHPAAARFGLELQAFERVAETWPTLADAGQWVKQRRVIDADDP